jgi:molybdopterin/thiamine biosynthesis adenylyltransferase
VLTAGHGWEDADPVSVFEQLRPAGVNAVEEDDLYLFHRHVETPKQIQDGGSIAYVQNPIPGASGVETRQGGVKVELDFHRLCSFGQSIYDCDDFLKSFHLASNPRQGRDQGDFQGKKDQPMCSIIEDRIRERTKHITDPAGREAVILEDIAALEIARQSGVDLHDIYRQALRIGVYPYRYIRNIDILSAAEQLRLAESAVAVVGAGGLGGQVILLLARLGIGTIVVVDYDLFDETNLNRQSLCSRDTLGKPKVWTAAAAVAAINAGVRVIPREIRLDADTIDGILAGSDVVVDGLDNAADRLLLQEAAGRLGVPMVHGALAGFEGRVMTILPGDKGVKLLYGETADRPDPDRPEAILGVPAVTAALIGTFQAMEVLKVLLKRGSLFRNAMAYMDLENGRLETFRFGEPPDKA